MPEYCFRDPNGCLVEMTMTVSEFCRRCPDETLEVDGTVLRLDVEAMHGGSRKKIIGKWPMRSTGAGCHPRQAGKFFADSVKRGVETEFDRRTGEAIFRDRDHRRKYLRAYGMHDKDGGYGD